MTNFTKISPAGGVLPVSVSEIGGIVLDMIGVNGARVISQIAANDLLTGFFNVSPGLIGEQTGFDAATIAALGGGIAKVGVRVTLNDGDNAPGEYDANDHTLTLNGFSIGNFTNIATETTNGNGSAVISSGSGFGNDQLATGWFYSTDLAFLNDFYNSLAGGKVQFGLTDKEVSDNFVHFQFGLDTATAGAGTAPIVISSGCGITVEGTALADTLNGTDCADIINGNGGGDVINAKGGDDKVTTFGENESYIDLGAGDDRFIGGAGCDNVKGGAGMDHINGGDHGDNVGGGAGDDIVRGGGGNDIVEGNEGDDCFLSGGEGNDMVRGGEGDDLIAGGLGNDVLVGGTGADRMYGNLGGDTFRYLSLQDSVTGAADQIHDFQIVHDTIDLAALGVSAASLMIVNQGGDNYTAFFGGNTEINVKTSGGVLTATNFTFA